MKKILLVEDEAHKRAELAGCLESFFKAEASITHVDSVHAAFWAVSAHDFDLIILDMALPTFSSNGSSAQRGHDQALGGVEVLRALKSRKISCKIIIVTQYPDITIGGKQLDVVKAARVLSERYNQEVVGGILYKYSSNSYAVRLKELLKGLR